jgi:hypothetical protein
MLAVFATMISSCIPREEPLPSGVPVPTVLMEHCLDGLDPHSPAVTARKRGKLEGYRLELNLRHPLRHAGFEDGDFVWSVNGHSLGTADAWHLARDGTRDQHRCVWEVMRRGSHRLLRAELVPWPAPQPPRPREDGTVVVSRSALARALTAVPDRLREAHSAGPYYPQGQRELQQLMLAAGLPEDYAVNAAGKRLIRSAPQLLEVLERLLSVDEADFVLRHRLTGESLGLRVLATGPAFPSPPLPERPPGQMVFVDDYLLTELEDTLAAWSRNQKGAACTALLHRGEDGEFDGYRLAAIQRDSPFEEMGFRNGDILQSIHGMKERNRDQLEAAVTALRGASWVEVRIRRRGKPLTLILDGMSL